MDEFIQHYFSHFVAVMVKGHIDTNDSLKTNLPIEVSRLNEFLGYIYIKSNYIGRLGHICNAGFLVSYSTRGKACGSVMGRHYLKLAPKLRFKSSVLNLVYETNISSCRIWDNLRYDGIMRILKAGRMKRSDELIDAIMLGYQFKK